MTDLPFNGKYVFHHKDGAECPWLSYSPQKDAPFFFFFLTLRSAYKEEHRLQKIDSWHGRLGAYMQTDREWLKLQTVSPGIANSHSAEGGCVMSSPYKQNQWRRRARNQTRILFIVIGEKNHRLKWPSTVEKVNCKALCLRTFWHLVLKSTFISTFFPLWGRGE